MSKSLPCQFVRQGRYVFNTDPNGTISKNPDKSRSISAVFPSISQAKRWSREFQSQNGGLGRGVVRTLPH